MRYPLFLLLLWVIFIGCKAEKNPILEVEDAPIDFVSSDKSEAELENLKAIHNIQDGAYILDWRYLLSTRFAQEYNEELGMEVDVPLFSDTLSALHGELVTLSGYYIPVDETGDENIVILSAYPYAQCFFCGQAGVESIIDILPQKSIPRLKTDDRVSFRGRLKLNSQDYDYLIYILEDAELIK